MRPFLVAYAAVFSRICGCFACAVRFEYAFSAFMRDVAVIFSIWIYADLIFYFQNRLCERPIFPETLGITTFQKKMLMDLVSYQK